MFLLSPNDVKEDRVKSDEESKRRSNALATEESRLANLISLARTETATEIEIIGNDFQVFKKETEDKRLRLQNEIDELENRRKQAMLPVTEIQKEAETILSDARLKLQDTELKEKESEKQREKNAEVAFGLLNKADELNYREGKIVSRETVIDQEMNRLAGSAKELAARWLEFHEATGLLNKKIGLLEKRGQELDLTQTALEVRTEALKTQEEALKEERRAIQAQYAQLAAARNEILGRTT